MLQKDADQLAYNIKAELVELDVHVRRNKNLIAREKEKAEPNPAVLQSLHDILAVHTNRVAYIEYLCRGLNLYS